MINTRHHLRKKIDGFMDIKKECESNNKIDDKLEGHSDMAQWIGIGVRTVRMDMF